MRDEQADIEERNARIAAAVRWEEREGSDPPDFMADRIAAERASILAGIPISTADSAADICARILRGT